MGKRPWRRLSDSPDGMVCMGGNRIRREDRVGMYLCIRGSTLGEGLGGAMCACVDGGAGRGDEAAGCAGTSGQRASGGGDCALQSSLSTEYSNVYTEDCREHTLRTTSKRNATWNQAPGLCLYLRVERERYSHHVRSSDCERRAKDATGGPQFVCLQASFLSHVPPHQIHHAKYFRSSSLL